MNPKDFFRIVLKILGLLLIVFEIIPTVMYFYGWIDGGISTILIFAGLLILLISFVYILIFNTDYIINIFKLDSGFEAENFKLSIASDEKIIQLSCIMIGLYMAVSSLPTILYEAFLSFKFNVSSSLFREAKLDNDYAFYTNIIYLTVGVLIIIFRKQVSKIFSSNE